MNLMPIAALIALAIHIGVVLAVAVWLFLFSEFRFDQAAFLFSLFLLVVSVMDNEGEGILTDLIEDLLALVVALWATVAAIVRFFTSRLRHGA
jgi:hypothetical protein